MKQLLDKNENKMTEIAVDPIWKKLYILQYYILVPLSSFLNLTYLIFHSPIVTEKIRLPHPFFVDFQKFHLRLMKKADSNS